MRATVSGRERDSEKKKKGCHKAVARCAKNKENQTKTDWHKGQKRTVRDPGEIKGKERKTGANGNPIGKYYRQYDAEKHDQTDTSKKGNQTGKT